MKSQYGIILHQCCPNLYGHSRTWFNNEPKALNISISQSIQDDAAVKKWWFSLGKKNKYIDGVLKYLEKNKNVMNLVKYGWYSSKSFGPVQVLDIESNKIIKCRQLVRFVDIDLDKEKENNIAEKDIMNVVDNNNDIIMDMNSNNNNNNNNNNPNNNNDNGSHNNGKSKKWRKDCIKAGPLVYLFQTDIIKYIKPIITAWFEAIRVTAQFWQNEVTRIRQEKVIIFIILNIYLTLLNIYLHYLINI